MRSGPAFLLLLLLFVCGSFTPATRAETAPLKPGDKIEALTVGSTRYVDVQIRAINARTVTITHAQGMCSLHLRDLSPEWQARFQYDPAADVAAERALKAKPAAKPRVVAKTRPTSKLEQLFHQFGQPAPIHPSVDLRPRFFELELGVKNQGRRPSCAIFAVVSALEFQNAEITGKAEKFSEEYLSWATRTVVHRGDRLAAIVSSLDENGNAPEISEDADEGFTLGEVVTALRGYGIPLQSSMPNTLGRALATIEAPAPSIIAEARQHQEVFVFSVPGHDNATRLNNIIHALDAGVPVIIGLEWPSFRSLRGGYLGGQKPMEGAGHAVTLVGYTAKGEQPEDVVFIFKNSWGVNWGQGGYGTAAYGYLFNYLMDAVVLEVVPRGERG